MDIDIKKNGKLTLKDTPYFEPIDNTNISFTNMDIGTARITFRIMKRGLPLQVSEKNVYVYAYLESSNGSRSEVIELNLDDPINGLVSLQLDKEFLVAATNTTVTGQLYISMHKWNTVSDDFSDTVALQEFTFTVKDALINRISGVTKIQYIRTFDQLKMRIEQQVKDIEEAIANGADYVAEMKSVLQQGVETLNAIVDDGKSDIQSFITQAKTDLTKVKDDATEDIATTANNAKSSIQDTASTAVNSINTKTTEATEHVDAKVTEFNQTVADNGFLSPEMLDEELDELEWQRYKLTENDGQRIRISDTDPVELNSGFYQMWKMKNAPEGSDDNTQYWNVDVTTGLNETKQIIATISASGKTYKKNIHKNEDKGWKEITSNQTDTGWIPFNLINGAKTNTNYKEPGENGFDCSYRTVKNGTVTERMIRLNGRSATHGQTIAQLPSTFCKNDQTFPIRVPVKYSGAFVTIRNSGEIDLYIQGDRSSWNEYDLFYGEFSWHD